MRRFEDLIRKRQACDLYRDYSTRTGVMGAEIEIEGRTYLNFSSNDYLGLAGDPRIADAAISAIQRYGIGSGSAHLIVGHTDEHQRLEQELAQWLGTERALLFSTGYMANMGIINALIEPKGHVFEDALNHASLLDGGLLSRGRMIRWPHRDIEALRQLMQGCDPSRSLIVTDGVFSMDGDTAPLKALAELARETQTLLMIDDAHGIGVLGAQGRGCVEQAGLTFHDVPIIMGTLGKAFGVFGAFVAGSDTLIDFLVQRARTYIYTTAPPPALAAAARAALRLVVEESWRRDHLMSLIKYFRHNATALGLALGASETPIQPLLCGDSRRALMISRQLAQQGIWVTPIRPPTVPEGSARLRISLSAAHQKEHIDQLLSALSQCLRVDESVQTDKPRQQE